MWHLMNFFNPVTNNKSSLQLAAPSLLGEVSNSYFLSLCLIPRSLFLPACTSALSSSPFFWALATPSVSLTRCWLWQHRCSPSQVSVAGLTLPVGAPCQAGTGALQVYLVLFGPFPPCIQQFAFKWNVLNDGSLNVWEVYLSHQHFG